VGGLLQPQCGLLALTGLQVSMAVRDTRIAGADGKIARLLPTVVFDQEPAPLEPLFRVLPAGDVALVGAAVHHVGFEADPHHARQAPNTLRNLAPYAGVGVDAPQKSVSELLRGQERQRSAAPHGVAEIVGEGVARACHLHGPTSGSRWILVSGPTRVGRRGCRAITPPTDSRTVHDVPWK